MRLNLFFLYDFDSTFDLSGAMLCDTNLTKTTFTKNTADLVFFFDIFDPLESFEVFEVQDVKEAALGRKTIFCDLSRE